MIGTKGHVREQLDKRRLYLEKGIPSNLRSDNKVARKAKTMREKDAYYRDAAERRINKPHLAYNAQNLYMTREPAM